MKKILVTSLLFVPYSLLACIDVPFFPASAPFLTKVIWILDHFLPALIMPLIIIALLITTGILVWKISKK